MRIGGYRIDLSEVDKKIWVLLAVVFLGAVFFFFFRPKEEPPNPDNFPAPGFSTKKVETLADQRKNWIDPYVEQQGGIKTATAYDQFLSISVNKGVPVSFRAYIPEGSSSEFPDLYLNNYNLSFYPSLFISPFDRLPPESNNPGDLAEDQTPLPLIQLAFPGGDRPTENTIIQVEGILWWQSDKIADDAQRPLSDPEGSRAPTVLVGKYQEIPPLDLQYPADFVADIDQTYRQDPYVVSIKDVLWSSGSNIRVCLSVTNTSNIDQEVWGVNSASSIRAVYSPDRPPLDADTNPDSESAFAASDAVPPGQTLTDYIVFGAPNSKGPTGSPEKELGDDFLEIRFPGIGIDPPENDSISLSIHPSQFMPAEDLTRISDKTDCS